MTEIKDNPFTNLVDLAANGNILFATDDFFQVAEHLILKEEPVWDEKKFTLYGKWMDGWETRRKRVEGHDWSIIKLGLSGTISGFHIDTAFFTGNQTLRISIQAACFDQDLPLIRRSELGTCATAQEQAAADLVKSDVWEEVLPIFPLRPGYPGERHHYFRINSSKRWTHLRVNYFPDGGVARLRVYGTVVKNFSDASFSGVVDLLAVENGAVPVAVSNSHYGTPFHIISNTESAGMYDGWETARNPKRPPIFVKGADGHLIIPGAEWAIFRVCFPCGGIPDKIIVDTAHFRGNYPESILIEGCNIKGLELPHWIPLVPRICCEGNKKHEFTISYQQPITHVKLTVFPDGGIARFRVWGKKVSNNLPNQPSKLHFPKAEFVKALSLLFETAKPLVEYLFSTQPFTDIWHLISTAEDALAGRLAATLTETELVEIMNAHPRIGAPKQELSVASLKEQSHGGISVDPETLKALLQINEEYEAKFGFRLVEFVNGRTRKELIPVLQKRLDEGVRESELKYGLQAIVDIARDRLGKY
ncbi:hypothetical protein HK100_006553 [Physocladia obscura]|uniref:Allantoicase n=1 Tax=Physocladia obscura TaxID=109957 RepID=A0AAD5T5R0_9FUNG|nr:hypothetical protein HK100_006553 [Physocladia obscura]